MMIYFARLWLLAMGAFEVTLAINRCSHSMNYRDLCPNPMMVSSGRSISSHGDGDKDDMEIRLTRRYNGTCEFFRNDDEVTSVGGIHVMDYAWPFSTAATCDHVVKLVLDRDTYGMEKESVCDKELGIKVLEGVTMWHNFTLKSTRFSFEDIISNYGDSPFDLLCTHIPKFVLLLFETYRDSKCSLVVQQYRVNDRRSNNCEYLKTPLHYFRFCGVYPCSRFSSILHELKLIARRVPNANMMEQSPTVESQEQNNHLRVEPYLQPDGMYNQKLSNLEGSNIVTPTTTTTTTTTEDPAVMSDGTLGDPKPIDYAEWAVRLFFPLMGVAFIFLLLSILKGRYANELCVKQGNPPAHYLGSIISLDKHGLKM